MDWTYLFKAKNNIHGRFPPLMSDSTLFTNWDAASKNNENVKNNAGITSNYDYRQWLIKNGNSVI